MVTDEERGRKRRGAGMGEDVSVRVCGRVGGVVEEFIRLAYGIWEF